MAAVVIDGKALAAKRKAQVAQQVKQLKRRPGLAVILVGDDPASRCLLYTSSFLDDACVPDGTSILEQAAALLGELLLHPATKNGRLRQDYVLSERKNLIQMIRSNRNDKRQYAQERLIEEMFAGEDYAVGRFGTVEQAEKINVAKLFAQYQTLLEQSPIELFYCGSAPAKRVELAWREALMGLPRSAERYPVETNAQRPPEREVRTFTESLDVTQGKMELGFRVGFGRNLSLIHI